LTDFSRTSEPNKQALKNFHVPHLLVTDCNLFHNETDRAKINQRVPLEEGAITIAKVNGRRVCEAEISRQISEIVKSVKEKVASRENPHEIIHCINGVLCKDFGFKGVSSRDYYNIENNFIDVVVREKKGIPISLGILYLVVARHMGIQLVGLNIPQHFLIYYPGAKATTNEKEQIDTDLAPDALFIDSYGGKIMTTEECLSFIPTVTNRTIRAEDLPRFKMDTVDIYTRMLRNIASTCCDTQGPDSDDTIHWNHHLNILERW